MSDQETSDPGASDHDSGAADVTLATNKNRRAAPPESRLRRLLSKVTWPVVLSVLTFALSTTISVAALVMSYLALRDTRAIHGLNVRPDVRASIHFELEPVWLVLANLGPGRAYEVDARLSKLFYSQEEDKVVAAMGAGTELSWYIPELTRAGKHFKVPMYSINQPVPRAGFLPVLELRVSYLRNPDFERYTVRSFYFRTSDGRWVSENNTDVKGEQYKKLKRAALNWSIGPDDSPLFDPIHPLEEE